MYNCPKQRHTIFRVKFKVHLTKFMAQFEKRKSIKKVELLAFFYPKNKVSSSSIPKVPDLNQLYNTSRVSQHDVPYLCSSIYWLCGSFWLENIKSNSFWRRRSLRKHWRHQQPSSFSLYDAFFLNNGLLPPQTPLIVPTCWYSFEKYSSARTSMARAAIPLLGRKRLVRCPSFLKSFLLPHQDDHQERLPTRK